MTTINGGTVIFSGKVLEEKVPEEYENNSWPGSIFFLVDNKILYGLNLNEKLRPYANKEIEIVVRERKEDET